MAAIILWMTIGIINIYAEPVQGMHHLLHYSVLLRNLNDSELKFIIKLLVHQQIASSLVGYRAHIIHFLTLLHTACFYIKL